MVLLVGAGLLGRSLYHLLNVDVGMQPNHLATLQVAAPKAGYSTNPQRVALARQVVGRVAALPGVTTVGLTSTIPIGSGGNTVWIRVMGRPYNGEHNEVMKREVSSEYFATLQARLVSGRYFSDAEDESKPKVVIVNQAFAKQYFPGEQAIGRHISYNSPTASPMEIIGIVEDIKEGPLDAETNPGIYTAFNQNPGNYFSVVVRTSQAEESVLQALSAAIHEISRDLATTPGVTMRKIIEDSQSAYLHRSSAWLVGGFAVLALLLGVIGLYGVVAYSVSQRTREIGVRMALGAQRKAVYELILKEAGRLTGIGIVVGLFCSIAAATLIRRLLFGLSSWDVPTLAAVTGMLGVAALLASFIPARRAASVNPVDALRAE
jgi:predicted permease